MSNTHPTLTGVFEFNFEVRVVLRGLELVPGDDVKREGRKFGEDKAQPHLPTDSGGKAVVLRRWWKSGGFEGRVARRVEIVLSEVE